MAALIAVLLLASVTAVVQSGSSGPPVKTRTLTSLVSAERVTLGDALPAAPVTTPSTVAPVPETTVPPAPPEPARIPLAVAPRSGFAVAPNAGVAPYAGLGTWVDVYDWSVTYTREAGPQVGPETVDLMAAEGVQTLFIQASKHDAPEDVLERGRLEAIIARAQANGIRVVAWYLPTLVDPAADMRRLLAIASLPVEGLAVDIEARNVTDVAERNRRLVQLSAELRSALPGRAIGGIVLPPVVMEEVNPNYWPGFPWREIAPYYDVWQTMGYWTNRKESSGWSDAYAYTMENVLRLRRNLGLPEAAVHPIGGIGDRTTPEDLAGFHRAAVESASIGGSLYDWRTTGAGLWPGLRPFRV
ncbi:MAG TPA: hypothetical protein VMY88_10135 [Acidimicrobiales bacterium]|nr:hypothetical protein [Acidimicrobiales bacterium]